MTINVSGIRSVRLQAPRSEPCQALGLGLSFPVDNTVTRSSLDSLRTWRKIETILLASTSRFNFAGTQTKLCSKPEERRRRRRRRRKVYSKLTQ